MIQDLTWYQKKQLSGNSSEVIGAGALLLS